MICLHVPQGSLGLKDWTLLPNKLKTELLCIDLLLLDRLYRQQPDNTHIHLLYIKHFKHGKKRSKEEISVLFQGRLSRDYVDEYAQICWCEIGSLKEQRSRDCSKKTSFFDQNWGGTHNNTWTHTFIWMRSLCKMLHFCSRGRGFCGDDKYVALLEEVHISAAACSAHGS